MRALEKVAPISRSSLGKAPNLLDVDLPRYAVVHPAVVDLDGQVSALVEPPKLGVGRVRTLGERLAQQRLAQRHEIVEQTHGYASKCQYVD